MIELVPDDVMNPSVFARAIFQSGMRASEVRIGPCYLLTNCLGFRYSHRIPFIQISDRRSSCGAKHWVLPRLAFSGTF